MPSLTFPLVRTRDNKVNVKNFNISKTLEKQILCLFFVEKFCFRINYIDFTLLVRLFLIPVVANILNLI